MNGEIVFFKKIGGGGKGSGEIRGTQIAAYLGATINPPSVENGACCVYVKMEPPQDYPVRSYLDIIDEHRRIPWLRAHPDVGVIASSLSGYEVLKRVLENKVVFIPQHHCNFNREVSVLNTGRIGVVGGNGSVQVELPIEYHHCKNYRTREDIVDFYKTIDVQIIWRTQHRPLKNPLKIINAMSFGIPTVAYPEPAYKEVDGFYEKAHTTEELVDKIGKIVHDPKRLIDKAEEYHIDNISKLYRSLL